MKKLIGFMADQEKKEEMPTLPAAERTDAPVKSLVRVRFQNFPTPLAYYNDRFDLQKGDVVYVSGKLAGSPGVVTSVTTKFRIHTSDYERVLSLLDLTVHGSFVRIMDKMVSFDQIAITPERFGSWVTPPEDDKKAEEDDDEVISGDGYTIDIHDIESCEDITSAIAERALNYCMEGRVRYLCVRNGVGRAYVEGSKWYRVDFRWDDGMMTDIYCDCPYSELCKHEVAVAFTLRMLHKQPEFVPIGDFMALDQVTFWKLASRAESIRI